MPTLRLLQETLTNMSEIFSGAILVYMNSKKPLFGDFYTVKRVLFGNRRFGLVGQTTYLTTNCLTHQIFSFMFFRMKIVPQLFFEDLWMISGRRRRVSWNISRENYRFERWTCSNRHPHLSHSVRGGGNQRISVDRIRIPPSKRSDAGMETV